MSVPADSLTIAEAQAGPAATRVTSRSATVATGALLLLGPPFLNWLVLSVGLGTDAMAPLFFGSCEGVALVAWLVLTRSVKDDLARVWGERPELAESFRRLRPVPAMVAFLFVMELAMNWGFPATAIMGLGGLGFSGFISEQVLVNAGQIAIWLGAVPLLSLCMAVVLATIIAQVGALAHVARGVEIDILATDRYAPLANPLVRVVLFLIVLTSILPAFVILSRDESLTRIMILSLPVGVPIMLVLVGAFVWPVWLVRERIRAAKRDELDRIHRALVGDAAAMRHSRVAARELAFSELLAWRAFVDSLDEWPVGRNLQRVALFGVVPPLTWVLAGLVENAVGSLMP